MVNKSDIRRRPVARSVRSLLFAIALGTTAVAVPAIAYADLYSTPNGDFSVEPTTNGNWEWTAENGSGGTAPTKREAKKAAKDSLKKKPVKKK